MSTLSRDTTVEAEAVMLEIYREMPPWKRLGLLEEASLLSMDLARAGLRSRCPDASPEVIERMLREMILGQEMVDAAYGPNEP